MTTIFTLKGASFTAPDLPILRTVTESLAGIASLMAWHLPSADRATNNGTKYSQAALNPAGLPLYVEAASAPTLVSETVKGKAQPVLNMVGKRLLWDGDVRANGGAFSVVCAMKLTRALANSDHLFRSKEDGFANNLALSTSDGATLRFGLEGKSVLSNPMPTIGEWAIVKFGRTIDGVLWTLFNGVQRTTADSAFVVSPAGLIVGGRYESTNLSVPDIILGEQFIFSDDVRALPEYTDLDNYLSTKWLS